MKFSRLSWLIAALGCVLASLAEAKVVPASLFCDHAVLQQGMTIPVWGTADENERVTVTIAGQSAVTVAHHGRWIVHLPELTAGGPYTLTIEGTNRIVLQDVLVGEVWICGGQSNMERQLGLREGQKPIRQWLAEAAAADLPQIRHFGVAQELSLTPKNAVDGSWTVCTPQTAPNFTAVGFFFGRALYEARHVPIGLIHSSWGGTVAEAWMSRDTIKEFPEEAATVRQLDKFARDPSGARLEYDRDLAHWFETNDPGSKPDAPWSGEALEADNWPTMRLPVQWEHAGLPDFDGVVWFRRAVDIPAGWSGKDVELHLGAIDDVDTTWVNGRLVGGDVIWNKPRVYRLPAGTLKTGRNIIAVRVLDTGGFGGLWGGDVMRLVRADDPTHPVALDGDWHFRASLPLHGARQPPLYVAETPNAPTVLYNGMIAPLEPYAIRGVIWYQGESNADHPRLYRRLFPALVANWRRAWGEGDFPFLYVQVAPFKEMPPEIREAQFLSLRRIPNSAMTVTLDVGDADDIHPADKRPVGERLALAARALAYHEKIEYSGPLFDSMTVHGHKAVLRFTHAESGLVASGWTLTGFVVAGADKVFHPGVAIIVGDTIEVTSDAVATPIAVRYGWADFAEGNLYNRAGLPASPFRTDVN